MRYPLLATDYDGTLALRGAVDAATLAGLDRWRAAGGRLLLITGRIMPELRQVFPQWQRCDRIVAENGGLLVIPSTGEIRRLGPPPPAELIRALEQGGVTPLSIGDVLLGMHTDHLPVVAAALNSLGLNYRTIVNKTSLMLLPPGIDKRSGLLAALEDLQLSPHQCVGVGDAENDVDFLRLCGLGVAVSNALPEICRHVHRVTRASHGAGVVELIDAVLSGQVESLSTPPING